MRLFWLAFTLSSLLLALWCVLPFVAYFKRKRELARAQPVEVTPIREFGS